MDTAIESRFARSFKARLYVHIDDWVAPLRPSKYNPLGSSDLHAGLLSDGWLMAGGKDDSAVLSFDFAGHADDRLHYHISASGPDSPGRLGISRNGYLGFYKFADATDYWKVEPLQLTAQGLLCNLRDHQGNRVGLSSGKIPRTPAQDQSYLNVEQGEVFTFLLKLAD